MIDRSRAPAMTDKMKAAAFEAVYVLHHVKEDDEYAEDAKLVGVYRSQEAAEAAIARLSKQPGFCDYPAGFKVKAYQLDRDHWTEGFVAEGG